MHPRDNTISAKGDRAPRGAYLAHVVFPSDPHRLNTPASFPRGNQGYPSSGDNGYTHGAYLPILFILFHTNKHPCVIGVVHLERRLDAVGIPGAPARFLPAIV